MGNTRLMGELLDEIRSDYRYTAGFTGREQPDAGVLKALAGVERHLFVPDELVRYAYDNRPLPIGYGQTISQPYIVALMTDFLEIEKDDTILEIGTGCGYQTAVLSLLARKVYSIEIVAPLALVASERLARLGYDNVEVRNGDGSKGWPEQAPFDGIIVTAAAEEIPAALFEQLAPDGRLVLPIGAPHQSQHLYLVTRGPGGAMQKRHLLEVAFVPLVVNDYQPV
jgi:protein-L-isoaspartate(D-aspartate) O-methyltransferase